MNRRTIHLLLVAVLLGAGAGFVGTSLAAKAAGPATEPELVSAYGHLADVILGTRNSEESLVKAICADAYRQARTSLTAAKEAVGRGDRSAAGTSLERAASAVALIAEEGDRSVAAVRNRLLKGGHHHHANGEKEGAYDPGFVVITKVAKKALLERAGEIGKLAAGIKSVTVVQISKVMTDLEKSYRKAVG